MENENWKIIIDDKHCPFCVQDLTANEWYCTYSRNNEKECAEGLCPVSSQQSNSADNEDGVMPVKLIISKLKRWKPSAIIGRR